MKTLVFKLPEFGKQIGTSSWVAEKLEEISKSFQNGKTKRGTPALLYDEKKANGEIGTYIFCTVRQFDYHIELEGRDNVMTTYAIEGENGDPKWGLFKYLTPKAEQIVEEFINDVSAKWFKELEKL